MKIFDHLFKDYPRYERAFWQLAYPDIDLQTHNRSIDLFEIMKSCSRFGRGFEVRGVVHAKLRF